MPTARQIELLAKEDWRHYAIDTYGTGLISIATTEKIKRGLVSFSLPSAPALYLSLAQQAHLRRNAVDLEQVFIDHPPPQGVWPDDHTPLFDYFEVFIAEVVFSFCAIEVFANEAIPRNYIYVRKKGKCSETFEGHEIERSLSLDEKLKKVLPQAHSIQSPAGTKDWEDYLALKHIRDRLIHLKMVDRSASGPTTQTIWGISIERRMHNYPEIAQRIIGSFEAIVTNRRWFTLSNENIGKHNQQA